MHGTNTRSDGTVQGSTKHSSDGTVLPCNLLPCNLFHVAQVTCNLKNTYTTEEDLLLWQNQRSVQQMRLRGSKLLGGFLVVDRLLALLPSKMPALRCIELAKCSDLTVQELSKLVDSRAAQLVVVYGCAKISERDCVELQRGAADAVVVEYAM